ncbi:hypothetical protein HDF26_002297 [Pedobacter cryoconitis]|uniref:hypothetical protein n=1 Tax=Pedobacter cryoconitis TaxID=188932 RepID=UPI001619691C|nr:hypothetical protein [Pedobacter cryoconitis]MBB6271840.1 hypothetical protein [Pedobacter cryoconitis]
MKFEKMTRCIYVTPEGDQVFTFIKAVNDQEGFYVLDFENQRVKEAQFRLNTHPVFSVPHRMHKDHLIAYHLDQLVNLVVEHLVLNHSRDDLKIYRDMDTIYLETAFSDPKILEDKQLLNAEIEHFNKMIGQVNKAVRSRFNKQIEVVLKFPFQRHQLHSVRL